MGGVRRTARRRPGGPVPAGRPGTGRGTPGPDRPTAAGSATCRSSSTSAHGLQGGVRRVGRARPGCRPRSPGPLRAGPACGTGRAGRHGARGPSSVRSPRRMPACAGRRGRRGRRAAAMSGGTATSSGLATAVLARTRASASSRARRADGHGPAPVVGGQDQGAVDLLAAEGDQLGHPVGQPPGPAPLGPAHAGLVDGDHPPRRDERGQQVAPHVAPRRIAVDADHRPRRAGPGVEDVPVDRSAVGAVDDDPSGPGRDRGPTSASWRGRRGQRGAGRAPGAGSGTGTRYQTQLGGGAVES